MRSRLLGTLTALLSVATLGSAGTEAGDTLGLRVGAYADSDRAFAGVEYRHGLDGRLLLAPNLEWVFVDNGTYFSLNADLHYVLRTSGRVAVWTGAGLGIFFRNPEGPRGTNTDLGLNLLGGFGLKTGIQPHVQAKLVVKGDAEFVIGFGIRF
jgi:hypothetical protein